MICKWALFLGDSFSILKHSHEQDIALSLSNAFQSWSVLFPDIFHVTQLIWYWSWCICIQYSFLNTWSKRRHGLGYYSRRALRLLSIELSGVNLFWIWPCRLQNPFWYHLNNYAVTTFGTFEYARVALGGFTRHLSIAS